MIGLVDGGTEGLLTGGVGTLAVVVIVRSPAEPQVVNGRVYAVEERKRERCIRSCDTAAS